MGTQDISIDIYNDVYETLLSSAKKLSELMAADPVAYAQAYAEVEKNSICNMGYQMYKS